MLSKKVAKALNGQIAMEAYSANAYLALASWCEVSGFRGATKFYYAQSDEERMHMLKLVKYVNASGERANIAAIKAPEATAKTLRETFEVALGQERAVSRSIHDLVDLAFKEKDFTTRNFLQWYVQEQHEEENLFKSILDLFGIAGKDDKSLLIIDSEILKVRDELSQGEVQA